jgi:uncharacterized protein (TIGR00725 family)
VIVTVFGSSRCQPGDQEYETARQLGNELARSHFAVCTGGYAGTMEAVSRGAADAGGRVLAVTARHFPNQANRWVQEETIVDTWEERLFKLIDLGGAYVALPGGTGTLAEIAVLWEMLNKRVIGPRPFVLLGEFWRPMVTSVDAIERSGKWRAAESPLLQFAADPVGVAALLRQNPSQ